MVTSCVAWVSSALRAPSEVLNHHRLLIGVVDSTIKLGLPALLYHLDQCKQRALPVMTCSHSRGSDTLMF